MKRRKIIKLIPILGIALFSMGCVKESSVIEATKVADQEVFFEVSYVNFAWGKQANGFFIDNAGNTKIFQGELKWKNSEMKGKLSETEMKDNLSLATISKKIVSADEFSKYTAILPILTDTQLSKKTSGGADRGSTVYYAYKFDKSTKTYTAIFLAEEGDFNMQNKDANAVKVTEWLKKIQIEAFKP